MSKIKIAHVSDWHSDYFGFLEIAKNMTLYDDVVELLLVTGDMLPDFLDSIVGMEAEKAAAQTREWERCVEVLEDTWPNAEIVAVPGNHDYCNYAIPGHVQSFDKIEPGHVMKVRGLAISGFRGVPWFHGTYHGECSDRLIDFLIAGLDPGSDIVMTHTPPYGILDEVGIRKMGAMRLEEWFINNPWCRMRIHAFGHCHERSGAKLVRNGTIFSNAAGAVNRFFYDY